MTTTNGGNSTTANDRTPSTAAANDNFTTATNRNTNATDHSSATASTNKNATIISGSGTQTSATNRDGYQTTAYGCKSASEGAQIKAKLIRSV